MAQLKTPVFGNISGTIGNVVFADKGDSNIVYKKTIRPKFTSPKLELIRAKFKLLSSVAIAINGTAELKTLWPSNKKIRRTRFNNIFQTNYNLVKTIADLGNPLLAPGYGFPVQNSVIATNETGITFASDAPGADSGINPGVEKYVLAAGIVVLRSPLNESDPAFAVLKVKSSMQSLDTDMALSLSNTYIGRELTQFQAYNDKKVFLVLITMTSDGISVNRSVQFSH